MTIYNGYSTDGGSTWTVDNTYPFWFENWGSSAGVTHKDLIGDICEGSMPGYTYLTENYTADWDSEDSLIDVLEPTDTFVSYANSSTRKERIQWLLSWTKEKWRLGADGHLHFINPTCSGTTYDYTYSI